MPYVVSGLIAKNLSMIKSWGALYPQRSLRTHSDFQCYPQDLDSVTSRFFTIHWISFYPVDRILFTLLLFIFILKGDTQCFLAFFFFKWTPSFEAASWRNDSPSHFPIHSNFSDNLKNWAAAAFLSCNEETILKVQLHYLKLPFTVLFFIIINSWNWVKIIISISFSLLFLRRGTPHMIWVLVYWIAKRDSCHWVSNDK